MSGEELSTGWELILNACEEALQIAITENSRPIAFQEWWQPSRATEILASALSEMCARAGIKPVQFRRIGCFSGPGSFTGIRLILSTAAALRRVSHAQLANLDYLQSLACTAVMQRGALYPQPVAVMTHARRNLVHFQKFTSFGPQIPPAAVNEVQLMDPETALAELAGTHSIVCGSGLSRYPDLFALPITGQGPETAPDLLVLPDLTTPSFRAICLLARHGDYFPKDMEPHYVRGCDAVENLEKGKEQEKLEKIKNILDKRPESDI